MEVQFKKHVRIICDLSVGDAVRTKEFSYKLDGKDRVVEEIKEAIGRCESGFLVKISGYDGFLDSDWLIKV